jgi:hypothetical protein
MGEGKGGGERVSPSPLFPPAKGGEKSCRTGSKGSYRTFYWFLNKSHKEGADIEVMAEA